MKNKNTRTALLSQVRELIQNARQAAYRNVNTLQVFTNFLIGKTIVEHEHPGKLRAAYGKERLTMISSKLTKEFGKGYSVDNLELMRKFYLAYQHRFGIHEFPISEAVPRKSEQKKLNHALNQKYETLPRKSSKQVVDKPTAQNSEALPRNSVNERHLLKLTWTHFVLLLKMDEDERRFYEIESAQNNWSTRELERQYNSSLYERLALSKDKKKVKQLS